MLHAWISSDIQICIIMWSPSYLIFLKYNQQDMYEFK